LRILYMVSSIGLGHAARSRVIATLLSRTGVDVDFIAPGYVGEFLRSWGFTVLSISRELLSLGDIFSRFYARRGSAAFTLDLVLEMNRAVSRNRALIEGSVDVNKYDAIIADESWEAMDSRILASGIPSVILIDFLEHRPSGLRDLLSSILVNRFLRESFRRFSLRLYIGFRETFREGHRHGFEYIGPVPPILWEEVLDRESASRELGLDPGERNALISLGGTGAGVELIRMIEISLKSLGFNVVVAPGSREAAEIARKAGYRVIDEKLMYRVPILIKAFDLVVSPAGLTTIALLGAAGIPGIIMPLRGHFEQIINARVAPKLFSNIASVNSPEDLSRISYVVDRIMGQGSKALGKEILRNPHVIATRVSKILTAEGTRPQ